MAVLLTSRCTLLRVTQPTLASSSTRRPSGQPSPETTTRDVSVRTGAMEPLTVLKLIPQLQVLSHPQLLPSLHQHLPSPHQLLLSQLLPLLAPNHLLNLSLYLPLNNGPQRCPSRKSMRILTIMETMTREPCIRSIIQSVCSSKNSNSSSMPSRTKVSFEPLSTTNLIRDLHGL